MSTISNSNKRIAHNTFFLYGRMLFVLFISIYTTRVVLKELGIVDYGIYNVVCGFVSMFNFFNTTMSSCTQRFYSFELGKGAEGDINKIYRTSIIIQLIIVELSLLYLKRNKFLILKIEYY